MEAEKVHFRHIMLHCFRKGQTVTQAKHEICSVHGEAATTLSTCSRWFQRFRNGNFDLEDAPRSGRPTVVENDEISAMIAADRHLTTREIAAHLCVDQSTVVRRLHALGMVSKCDVWVPHDLSEKNLMDRISISHSLLKRNEEAAFWKRLVTGDEKWIVYNNVVRKRSWCKPGEPPAATPKAGLHPKKVMLCIWWDWKGVVYYELLPPNQTINSDVYCRQLAKLKRALAEKRPELVNRKGVVFHHDNAKPHTSLQTQQKLVRLGWDVLPHPPHSPDLAPSDYHLFRSLQNALNGMEFASLDLLKNYLDEFFGQKSQNFYERGIMQLPERWQKVIDQNGQYIIE